MTEAVLNNGDMSRGIRFIVANILCGLLLLSAAATARADNELSWPPITTQERPWIWWWWPGSAVDRTNITNQLELFQQAGLGGVQIIPIYGAKNQEDHYIDFLGSKWMEMMGYTVAESHQLGMGVDMALETGWNFGGPTVSNDDANAFVVIKTFDVAAGETFDETFPRGEIQALMAFGPDGNTRDLTGKISSEGSIHWTVPPGHWRLYAVSQKFSGQHVKRAAPGGEGPMLNPFYPSAMRHYLQWFDAAFNHYPGPEPRAVFQDSYEYQCNWSPDFFAEFKHFRGYRLQTVLPAFMGDAPSDEVARVKSDYRQTVSDLMAVKTDPIWINWAHRHDFLATYQAHGSPGNWLDLYADADIPETEMFHSDRNPLISKFASSAADVEGRQLTGAETGTWLAEHFTETLEQLKYLTDDMFISGVNHIFYHGCCYSPADATWPGWVFYAATEMNPRNSIWHDVPALNGYVERCQAILQSGKPDNDILLYWPIADLWNNPHGMLQTMSVSKIGWFENQPVGKTANYLWNRGYSFDYISDRQLASAGMSHGEIRVPGGNYRVVLVPSCELMPEATLGKLTGLARSGATVIFESHLPADVPGWGNLSERRAKFKKLLAKIEPFQIAENLQEAKVGNGRILIGDDNTALAMAGVAREQVTDHAGLYFIRRSFNDGWHCFIANRHGQAFDGWIALGRPAQSIAILDPMTGSVGMAPVRHVNGQTEVYLQLQPGDSVVLRLFAHLNVDGPAWNYWQTNGPAVEITGNWKIKFTEGGPVLPASFQTTNLVSWTEQGDTNAQRFAGTALYTIIFDAPGPAGKSYFLNLGNVCQSARVQLNGKDYGTFITLPFGVVVNNLKPTGNRLEIEVTNVSANRIRDMDQRHLQWKILNDINVVNINYHPFDASNWPLTDSGLLGPVTLTPVVTTLPENQGAQNQMQMN